MEAPAERPPQARSVATRRRLLDAAIDCLVTDGYAALTTVEVARRAGVSRGAQLHHFPTKAQLVAAAIEHYLDGRIDEFERRFAADLVSTDAIALVDALWDMFASSHYAVWAELWIAARTDPDLAALMVDVDRRFTERTRLRFVELVSIAGADPAELEMLRDFAFAVMSGVALQRLVPRGQRPVSDYLDLLKSLVASRLSAKDRS
jgi:AcrR family transcriptional regulator